MHPSTLIKRPILVSGTILLAVAASCNTGSESPQLQPPTVNVTGSWSMTEVILQATSVCAGDVGDRSTYTLTARQNGNNLTVTTSSGTFTGTVSGNKIQWTGSYPDDGGTVTITSLNITATATSLSGTANWTWTHPNGDSCTGVTRVTGAKAVPLTLSPPKPNAWILVRDEDSDESTLVPGLIQDAKDR